MNVDCVNRCPDFSVNESIAVRLAEGFTERIPPGTIESLSLVFVGDEEMEELNQTWLSHEGTTDVISFLYPPAPGTDESVGEVIVNLLAARREANGHGHSISREAALYIAHGIDHIGGADDDLPERKAIMLEREEGWVRDAESAGIPLEELVSGVPPEPGR